MENDHSVQSIVDEVLFIKIESLYLQRNRNSSTKLRRGYTSVARILGGIA